MSCKMVTHPRATTKTCQDLVRQVEMADRTLTRLDGIPEMDLDLGPSGGLSAIISATVSDARARRDAAEEELTWRHTAAMSAWLTAPIQVTVRDVMTAAHAADLSG